MYKISNEFLEASINPKGAELVSLIDLSQNQQLMWSADPAFWAKTSPVLFPIVGSLKQGYYTYKAQDFALSRHGFGRDKQFELLDQDPQQLIFLLKDSLYTREVYPFGFELYILYSLEEKELIVRYIVRNTEKEVLPYSIGAHPALAIDASTYDQHYLGFDQIEDFQAWTLNAEGLLDLHTRNIGSKTDRIALNRALFYQDALVFKKLKSQNLGLYHQQTGLKWIFNFSKAEYLGIWAAKNAPFVCIEPWWGIADHIDHNHEILEKEGIRILGAHEEESLSWSIRLA
jgi:galactose mutarotase-like enzyme